MFIASLISACATITTGSHYDNTTDFGTYRTYSWIDENAYIGNESSPVVSPLSRSKIEAAIRTNLEKKGYSFTTNKSDADFVVSYTVGARDKISIDAYPLEYRGRWGWHVPYSYYYYREFSAHTYTQGTLGVDIFDKESGKPVWHGWAEKTVTESDRADPSDTINEGVRKLFEKFP